MNAYDTLRETYRPAHTKVLVIAESQPPAADVDSSRHFYRSDKPRRGDRLFVNTIRAVYPKSVETPEAELEQHKEEWLRRFQKDGWYMIEALQTSLPHEVTKPERQDLIRKQLPQLLERVHGIAEHDTKIILVKSNVFDVATVPLREAGFTVLNKELIDYPGRFNQRAYREKLAALASHLA